MTIIVRITKKANSDLQKISNYIASDNPVRAESYIAEVIWNAIKTISSFPYSCPIYNQLGTGRGFIANVSLSDERKLTRCYVYGKYKVLYWVDSDHWEAHILRVIHSAALFGALIDGG